MNTAVSNILKIIGVILLLIPMGLLMLLGIGELVGGTISGLQHGIQALPILLLLIFAWKNPDAGGKIAIILTSTLLLLYLLFPPQPFPLLYRFINGAILFGPAMLAGVMFFIASKRKEVYKI